MTDGRRVGHAQRRRIGASSNAYADTMLPPTYSPGDSVQAAHRYGALHVVNVMPNVRRPDRDSDGHVYLVQGGKGGRVTAHLSGELRPFNLGREEAI